jgi:hypothetical protein
MINNLYPLPKHIWKVCVCVSVCRNSCGCVSLLKPNGVVFTHFQTFTHTPPPTHTQRNNSCLPLTRDSCLTSMRQMVWRTMVGLCSRMCVCVRVCVFAYVCLTLFLFIHSTYTLPQHTHTHTHLSSFARAHMSSFAHMSLFIRAHTHTHTHT